MPYSKAIPTRGQEAHAPDEDLDFHQRAPNSRAYCFIYL
jgi:hypothetical protein